MEKRHIVDLCDNEINEGDFLDVQKVGIHRVFEFGGALCFTPYGRIERVIDYTSNSFHILQEFEVHALEKKIQSDKVWVGRPDGGRDGSGMMM